MAVVKKRPAVKKKAAKKRTPKMIEVGVMGRAVTNYAFTKETSVKELASTLGISFTHAEASVNGVDKFKEVKEGSVVNGFKAILFTPQVDGGK